MKKYIKGHEPKGDKHHQWKGGITKHNGYIRIYKPNHPKTSKSGYIAFHRYAYEQYYNCCLLDWIDIHHINGIKDDNRIENLKPLTHIEHKRLHAFESKGKPKGKYKTRPKKDMTNRYCLLCKSKTTFTRESGYQVWHKYENGYVCNMCHQRMRRAAWKSHMLSKKG